MKIILQILICSSLLLGGAIAVSAPAYAQFAKTDATKTPSKFTVWAQTQKSKCEKTMEKVQNSGFGRFVGDAVKYTKDGIKYAKDMYEKGMDYYNQTKDAVLNSPEYKMAMISKEIATESMQLKKIQEQKLEKQKEIEAEMELLKEQTAAKIEAARKNIEIVESEATEENAKTESSRTEEEHEADKEDQDKEDQDEEDQDEENAEADNEEARKGVEAQIDLLEAELEAGLADAEARLEEINEEFQEKIIKQTEKIAKLSKELSEVASEKNKNKKTEASKETLKKNHNLFFSSGKPSISMANKIKKQRAEAAGEAGQEIFVAKSKKKLARSANVDKVETKEDLADTMPGESEGSGISTEVLGEQLNILLSYAEVVLADIKMQAAAEISGFHNVDAAAPKETFNLCDYTDKSNVGLEGAKKKVSKVTNVVSKGMETYNKVQNKVAEVKDKVNEVKDKVDQAKETVSQVQDLAEQAKGMNLNADAATAFMGN